MQQVSTQTNGHDYAQPQQRALSIQTGLVSRMRENCEKLLEVVSTLREVGSGMNLYVFSYEIPKTEKTDDSTALQDGVDNIPDHSYGVSVVRQRRTRSVVWKYGNHRIISDGVDARLF